MQDRSATVMDMLTLQVDNVVGPRMHRNDTKLLIGDGDESLQPVPSVLKHRKLLDEHVPLLRDSWHATSHWRSVNHTMSSFCMSFGIAVLHSFTHCYSHGCLPVPLSTLYVVFGEDTSSESNKQTSFSLWWTEGTKNKLESKQCGMLESDDRCGGEMKGRGESRLGSR